MFAVLVSFIKSLTAKYMFLNDEQCMVRPTLIDLNPVEFKYPFMISLYKCNGCCNVLSPKQEAWVPKETKDITVKAFNMITNKNAAKTMTKNISCDCKCKFNHTTCHSNKKIMGVKKMIAGILRHWYFSDWVWWNYNCY